ncbi:hypothetical protein BT69DRAFT_1352969 [Atractiella rhizophila]|nr:hypothetical protein BT69DRAFT_1352969 [Atractiella rhizophila]
MACWAFCPISKFYNSWFLLRKDIGDFARIPSRGGIQILAECPIRHFTENSKALAHIRTVLDRKLCYTDSGAPIGDDDFPQLKLYLALTVVIWIQAERRNRTFSSATANPFVNVSLAIYLKDLWMCPLSRRLLDSQRPTSLPPQGVWPYATTAPDLTLFTGFTGATATNPHPPNPPGSSPTQFPVPIWTLPEFVFQEMPAKERYVGMTTEEAVSRELARRGMTTTVTSEET